jgi:hypothetical protein
MEASSTEKRWYGGRGRRVRWARLGCWISQCFDPFSLGALFETYEPFIALVFKFFSGRGKPRITETTDTESVDTVARLYYKRFCALVQKLQLSAWSWII